MKQFTLVLLVLFAPLLHSQVRFEVPYPDGLTGDVLDGRLLVMISTDGTREPRFQITDDDGSQQVFGIDVENWRRGESRIVDASAFGYPVASLRNIPDGTYWVQALVHVYETFHRSDGYVVKLPMDRGEGQQWNRAPGNPYSTPQKVTLSASSRKAVTVALDKVVPDIMPPKDTKYIRHVRIQSKLLTDFWGRPMHLGANVLLPAGWDEHPNARYPLVIFHGHFPYSFGGFREEPPDPNLVPDTSARFGVIGYNRIVQQEAYNFYKQWTGPDYPRFIIIEIQHANPYYDDSYAVNSQNLGPYGDAIMKELVPYVETTFRGIGEGWGRFTYGGSTGGWEALAVQILYPDDFNGCFAACPDPIDFRAYTVVNIYEDENAYHPSGTWKRTPRPAERTSIGHVTATLEDVNRRELALGTKSRSGQQWDIWEAVYSPVGDDGYPKRIWDKTTGLIDRKVAAYWRENYDLSYILRRDWVTLGPKLEGKIHIYCGDMDTYYLNNAVYLVEDFLKETKNPFYGGEVDYGDRQIHCWNGDHENPIWISRLRYHQLFAPKIVERILKTAPKGADVTSWRY